MADRDARDAARPALAPALKLAVLTITALGGAAVVYVMGGAFFKPGPESLEARGPAGMSGSFSEEAQAAVAEGRLHAIPPLLPRGQGAPAPSIGFQDAAGKAVKLTDFKGRVLVVNFWATWCAPCRQEMPTLAKLATAMQGRPVKIVALSVDTAAASGKARAFIAQNAPLGFYQDATMTVPFKLTPPVTAFPTTLIYDKAGRLRATAKSDLDWDGPRALAVIGKLAAE